MLRAATHGDRGRDPRGRRQQARLPPGADPRATGACGGAAGPADRAVGDPAPDRGRGQAAGRRGPGPVRRRRLAALLDRRLRPPAGARPRPGAAGRRARRRRHGRADGRDPRPDRRARAASTGPRSCSSIPGGWPSGSPTSSASGSATARSPPTTGACRRTAGSGSRPGCAAATCGRWWRPPRSSWASTSGRSSWSARSARRAASPPSCSGSAGPTTPAPASRQGGCTPRPGTSWSSAPRCSAARARAGSTRWSFRRARSTSWRSRSWRSARPRTGPQDDLLALVRGAAPFAAVSAEDFDEVADAASARASAPAAAAGPPTCTGTRSTGTLRGQARRPAGGAHLRRRDPRARRLPGAGRAGQRPRRHRQRGLGDREHGRRRVPARHHLVADPPGRARHRPGRGRARRAAIGAVLARRGARPHRRAVRGGLRAQRRGRRASWPRAGHGGGRRLADGRVRDRRRGRRDDRGLPRRRRWRSSGCCRRWTRSCSSGSSTRPAACSWSGTRRSAPG